MEAVSSLREGWELDEKVGGIVGARYMSGRVGRSGRPGPCG
jgi:hypothetical protein